MWASAAAAAATAPPAPTSTESPSAAAAGRAAASRRAKDKKVMTDAGLILPESLVEKLLANNMSDIEELSRLTTIKAAARSAAEAAVEAKETGRSDDLVQNTASADAEGAAAGAPGTAAVAPRRMTADGPAAIINHHALHNSEMYQTFFNAAWSAENETKLQALTKSIDSRLDLMTRIASTGDAFGTILKSDLAAAWDYADLPAPVAALVNREEYIRSEQSRRQQVASAAAEKRSVRRSAGGSSKAVNKAAAAATAAETSAAAAPAALSASPSASPIDPSIAAAAAEAPIVPGPELAPPPDLMQ